MRNVKINGYLVLLLYYSFIFYLFFKENIDKISILSPFYLMN